MSIEPTYRIDRHSPTSPDNYGVVEFREGQPYTHVGVLVPDTRLQTIADAWNEPWQWGRLTQVAVIDRWAVLGELLDELVERDNP